MLKRISRFQNPVLQSPVAKNPVVKNSINRLRKARQSAFTLIEIMVVIIILGVLAALVVPKILSRPDEARVTVARQDIATILNALKLYKLDNSVYPNTEQGLDALVKAPTVGVIPNNWKQALEKIPKDPWGRPYQYQYPGTKAEIDIWSLGADGQVGGTGVEADIGSWNL